VHRNTVCPSAPPQALLAAQGAAEAEAARAKALTATQLRADTLATHALSSSSASTPSFFSSSASSSSSSSSSIWSSSSGLKSAKVIRGPSKPTFFAEPVALVAAVAGTAQAGTAQGTAPARAAGWASPRGGAAVTGGEGNGTGVGSGGGGGGEKASIVRCPKGHALESFTATQQVRFRTCLPLAFSPPNNDQQFEQALPTCS